MENQMRLSMLSGLLATAAVLCLAAIGPAPAGQPAPITTTVTGATVFSGICQDCMLPLEFKSGQSGKSCAVCGCAVNNATCIAGKPVKDGTWQSMMKLLPQ